jgi:hypothetical protein
LSARVGSQVTQAAPPDPQVVVDFMAQVEPEQQPLGQFVVLQSLHTPPVQMRPAQFWHRPPPLPQIVSLVPARQVVPEQQPLGQDVRSQTHAPVTQCCPVPHGAPRPHAQVPVVEQRSTLVAAQATQAPPPMPQLAMAGVRQMLPVQQPVLQDNESQTQVPFAQRCPVPHARLAPQAHPPAAVQVSVSAGSQVRHAAPGAPQRASERDTQVVPSQHPVGHEVALQTHFPVTQRWPAPHAGAVPHVQVPVAAQPSARVASQPTHTAPPLPQVASAGGLQVAPEQQPPGQLVALQPLQ